MTIQTKKDTARYITCSQIGSGQWELTAHGGRKAGATLRIYAVQYDHIRCLSARGNGYLGANYFNDLWSQF